MDYESYKEKLEANFESLIDHVNSWDFALISFAEVEKHLRDADLAPVARSLREDAAIESVFFKATAEKIEAHRRLLSGLKEFYSRAAPRPEPAFVVEETVKSGWLGFGKKTQTVVVEPLPAASEPALKDDHTAQRAFNQMRAGNEALDKLLGSARDKAMEHADAAEEFAYKVKLEVVTLNAEIRDRGGDRQRESRRFYLEDMASALSEQASGLVLHARAIGALHSKEYVENPFEDDVAA